MRMSGHPLLLGLQDENECSPLPCPDYRMRISVYSHLKELKEEEKGEKCGESVERVCGECGESVWRVYGECMESVERVWGECIALVYMEFRLRYFCIRLSLS